MSRKPVGGRPRVLAPDKGQRARDAYLAGHSVDQICDQLGISRATLYRYKTDWKLDALDVAILDYLGTPAQHYNRFPDGLGMKFFDIQVVRNLAQSLSLKVRFHPVSSAQLFSGVESGRFDISIGLIADAPQRRQRVAFSEPYSNTTAQPTGALVTRASSGLNVERPESLAGKRLGVLAGSLSHEWLLLRPMLNTRIVTFARPGGLSVALRQGQLDASLEAISFQRQIVASLPGFELVPPFLDYGRVRTCIAVNREDDRLVDRISTALVGLRKDGVLDRLEERRLVVSSRG